MPLEIPHPPTLLLAAIGKRDRDTALALIANGKEINTPDTRPIIGDEATPLHSAVLLQWLEVVQALIKAGAEIDAVTLTGQTPLWFAANCGYFEIAKYLLEAGADPNIRSSSGYMPLGRVPGTERTLFELLKSWGGLV